MLQESLDPDDPSHFLNTDPIEIDDWLLTDPMLIVTDETGPSQSSSERPQLQHEPLLDPQMSTSTIL